MVLRHDFELQCLTVMTIREGFDPVNELVHVGEAPVLSTVRYQRSFLAWPLDQVCLASRSQGILLSDLIHHSFADGNGPVEHNVICFQVFHGSSDQTHLHAGKLVNLHLVSGTLIVLAAVRTPTILGDGSGFFLIAAEKMRDDTAVRGVELAV